MTEPCDPPVPLTLLTTEADLLPSGALALSSVNGAGGLFTPGFFCGALSYSLGGALTSPLSANASLDIWLLATADGASFEYGQATGDVTFSSSSLTAVASTDGIWFDPSTSSASAYAFDLTVPANIAIGTYVVSPPGPSTVALSLPALGTGTGDRLAFVVPPARAPDFSLAFAQRTYVAGELVWDTLASVPPFRFKALLRNNLRVTLPAGGALTLQPPILSRWVLREGRELESWGRIRIL